MKKYIVLLLIAFVTIFQAHAVLKEKDLSQTLGILRAELERSYNEQQMVMAHLEKRSSHQHEILIQMMQKSNQIALMLYSQNSDFTFDMAYACQEATEQYRRLSSYHLPYTKMQNRMQGEIDRYEKLIKSLQNLPPRVLSNGELAKLPDSIKAKIPQQALDSAKKSLFLLDEQGLEDRAACLKYAIAIRDNYVKLLESLSEDKEHYAHITKRVKELNDYAMSRYEKIQQSIFVNGGENYFTMLKQWQWYYMQAKKDADDKYKPFKRVSEWRGPVILGITVFMLTYIIFASLLSYVIMRWLLPKKWRSKFNDLDKRPFMTLACGVAIFAVSIMIASLFIKQNFILMAINLMITFAWLLEVILLSLLIRLKDSQIKAGIRVYTPFLLMALLVIVFRIILIPNNLVNLIYPPILLIFTIWQIFILKRRLAHLPDSDMIYTVISTIAMLVACVASWLGFVLLAVEIMIWWIIQLAAIQTITCLYDVMKWYEVRYLMNKIIQKKNIDVRRQGGIKKIYKNLKPALRKGEYIADTWFFDFLRKVALPVACVISVLVSIYSAARIFEMTSFCRKIFLYVFLDKPGFIQLSLFKICLVIALYFVFKYLNYAFRAFYQLFKKRHPNDENEQNISTVGNNIISFVVWGIYVISALILLQVPSSGISIVLAGLATGLGFAMKDLLENFVYGISLMAGRLRVGDYIECEGIQGKVESINYQSTQIVTLDGSVIAFQNATLFSKNFKNLTRNHGYVQVKIPVGVAYGVDVQTVRTVLLESLQPLTGKNAAGKYVVDPKQSMTVRFADFGESSVDLFVVCWVLVEEKIPFVAQVQEIIYQTLNKNRIPIPFPQRDVYVHHVEKEQ